MFELEEEDVEPMYKVIIRRSAGMKDTFELQSSKTGETWRMEFSTMDREYMHRYTQKAKIKVPRKPEVIHE